MTQYKIQKQPREYKIIVHRRAENGISAVKTTNKMRTNQDSISSPLFLYRIIEDINKKRHIPPLINCATFKKK
jgi:hypothetical protein